MYIACTSKAVNDSLTLSSAMVYALSTVADLRDAESEPDLGRGGRSAASLNASTTTFTVLENYQENIMD